MTAPNHDLLARRWFGRAFDELHATEQRAIDHAMHRRLLATDTNATFAGRLSFGERLADRVARFGGSWTFIILFALMLAAWTLLNAGVLARPFDPYPFIFLNLMLSMLAAVQAPIIMMSQNRQASKDRLDAAHDYEVNLRAEMEIVALHEKLDAMRDAQLAQLVERQDEQLRLIRGLLEAMQARDARGG